MNDDTKKYLNGNPISQVEWVRFLKRAHQQSPGMTPKFFEQLFDTKGKNSYQILSEVLNCFDKKPLQILDLACGNGHLSKYIEKQNKHNVLTGIDMSPEEITLANKIKTNLKVNFFCESADKTSSPSQLFDAILCHMGLMLMSPLEPIVKEMHRVLKSGGLFSSVINRNSSNEGDFLVSIKDVLNNFYKQNYPNRTTPVMGDPRVFSEHGLKQIFNEYSGFKLVHKQDFVVSNWFEPEQIWPMIKNKYLISMLNEKEKTLIGKNILRKAKEQAFNGKVKFGIPLQLITLQKL